MKTILETNLQGYDTVVALTQNNINANLKYLTGAKDGILPEVTLKIDAEDATLKAVMAPPTVKLNVPNQNHTVVFIVSLRKGYFEF